MASTTAPPRADRKRASTPRAKSSAKSSANSAGGFHQSWYAIARSIERRSGEALQVGHGSLYPALQRLLKLGLITAEDGISENNRKARFYRLTAKGRKQLFKEASRWQKLSNAIALILASASKENP